MATFNIKVRTAGDIAKVPVTVVRQFSFDGADIDDAIAQAKLDDDYKLLTTLKGMVWEEDV